MGGGDLAFIEISRKEIKIMIFLIVATKKNNFQSTNFVLRKLDPICNVKTCEDNRFQHN